MTTAARPTSGAGGQSLGAKWDVFVSHASEDKEAVVEPLVRALQDAGLSVWYDRVVLKLGDSLRQRIEHGLANSRYGIVILSPTFLARHWPQQELNGLAQREVDGAKAILPVWYNLTAEEVRSHSPILADRLAARWSDGLDAVVSAILDVVRGDEAPRAPQPPAAYPGTVPPLPAYFVARPTELDVLREAVVQAGSRATVAIRGMGGLGKTLLAQALCHDPAVRAAFPDGAMWLHIGRHPTDQHLIEQIREIGREFHDDLARYDTLTGCRTQLRNVLNRKRAVIVLDDVWNAQDVRHLQTEASPSRVVVTTRERDVVIALGAQEPTSLHALELQQARRLIALWSRTPVEDLPPEASKIIAECGGLPLAVAMAGAAVQKGGRSWSRVLKRFEQADLAKIRLEFCDYPYPDLFRAVEVSLELLDADCRSRYLEFAVFPGGVPVPTAAFAALWNVSEDDAAETLETWTGASLAQLDAEGRVTLHDLQFDYVGKQCRDVAALHRKLVEGYRSLCPNGWAAGPADGYFFEYLSYHLDKAGLHAELANLLLDPGWIRAKLKPELFTGGSFVPALLGDYEYLPAHPDVQLVAGAIRLSASLLSEHRTLLTSQLTGRLRAIDSPAMRNLLDSIRRAEEHPWLEPVSSSLMTPGEPLLATMALSRLPPALSAAVMPDGRRFVCGYLFGEVVVWDLETAFPVRVMEVGPGQAAGAAVALAATPDGERIISGHNDGSLKLWDPETGKLVRSLDGHADIISDIVVLPDGKRMLSASLDGTIRLWDLQSGRPLGSLDGHRGSVYVLAVTPDGTRAVSTSADRTLRLWDLARCELVRTGPDGLHVGRAAAITPDGRRALFATADGALNEWDLDRGAVLRTFGSHDVEGIQVDVHLLEVCPDGKRAIAAFLDRLKIWDLERGEAVGVLEGHTKRIWSVAVLPGSRRALSVSEDGTAKLWDLERAGVHSSRPRHRFQVDRVWFPNKLRALSYSAAPPLILAWDVHSGEACERAQWIPWPFCISRGAEVIVYTRDRTQLEVLAGSEPPYTLGSHDQEIKALDISPDGALLVSASADRTVKVWDVRGRRFGTLEGHRDAVNAVVVTPDWRRAISGSADGELRYWDLEQGRLLHILQNQGQSVNAVALTPDGKYAVSGSSDCTLKLWDLSAGRLVRSLEGHLEPVRAIALSPDGRTIVSASEDRTLKLWDFATGREIAAFGGDSAITACAVSPDGGTFIAGEASGSVHLLRLVEPA